MLLGSTFAPSTLILLWCFLPGATLAPILSPSELLIIVELAIGCLDWVC